MRYVKQIFLVYGMLSAFCSQIAHADWMQWRGANRDGKVADYAPPRNWSAQLARVWSAEVGEGYASPVAVGQHVYAFSREGNSEVVRCLRIVNGREVWVNRYPAPVELDGAAAPHGKGPKSTPVFADGRLYTFGISGILSAYDAATGKVLWRRTFTLEFQKTHPLYGTAMSPLVVDGMVIAHVGGHDKGALTAFDARTGQPRWFWNGDGPAYASPILVTLGGVRQIVTQTQRYCVGVAPDTGKVLWRIGFTTPYDQNSITPVLAGDALIFGGTQQPTFAVRVRKSGATWATEKLWETRNVTLYMSTPVVVGNRIYGLSERRSGQLFSLDAANGKVLWTNEGRFAENAALLTAGTNVFVLTNDADLYVFNLSGASLAQVAKYRVANSATWASPTLSGNRLFIKDAKTLTMWGMPQ